MRDNPFISFATRERILTILIKERVKFIGKKEEQRKNDIYKTLCSMLPARRTWVTPGKHHRSNLRNDTTRRRQDASTAIKLTIKRDRAAVVKHVYRNKLDNYIQEIQNALTTNSFIIEKPTTVPLFKKKEAIGDRVIVTCRPISVYKDLRSKVLLKLACDYLSVRLDPLFHEDILSYRKRRNYHGEHPKKLYMTKADDAIPNIQRFRENNEEVWVAECDIKKFYDIVNHDCVMASLARLLNEGGIPEDSLAGPISILQSYLDSYNFKECVLDKSMEPGYWDKYIPALSRKAKAGGEKVDYQFSWVEEEELPEGIDFSKIGIPQGGVFSTLICNILMNDVDRSIVDESDPNRLFIRFGDDIILMHAHKDKCGELFDAYKESLKRHQLIYHNEKNVGDHFKDGAFTVPAYWNEKTKAPFRWGLGEGNACEWIGFVGYEISCKGDVRLRKSTFTKQFSNICRKYHKVQGIKVIKTDIEHCLKDFDKVAWCIRRFKRLTFNPSSQHQMHLLDRYRHNKRRKAVSFLKSLPVRPYEKMRISPPRRPSSYASVLEKMQNTKEKE